VLLLLLWHYTYKNTGADNSDNSFKLDKKNGLDSHFVCYFIYFQSYTTDTALGIKDMQYEDSILSQYDFIIVGCRSAGKNNS